jgi:hypothetical protein
MRERGELHLMIRSNLICVATWGATSIAVADPPRDDAAGQAPAAASPAQTATAASPESPYDVAIAPAPPLPRVAPANDYGHAGQFELGGAFGVTVASDVRDLSGALSFGRFVADHLKLSATASVAHLQAGARSATLWSLLVEPSYHLRLDHRTFGVLCMGVGAAYEHQLGTGFAVAPRIGVNFLVGNRGVVTPALAYEYVTHRALNGAEDLAVAAVTGALRIQLGYATTW